MISCLYDRGALAGAWLTAFDALSSDLLGAGGACRSEHAETFFCGNFGLVLLELAHADKVKLLLDTMMRVTMMRGAQSAGLVTYVGTHGSCDCKGVRRRVVNGKRTNLCTLLLREYERLLKPSRLTAPQLFQGHTRFATSSIANLAGCHPHQWCQPAVGVVWSCDPLTNNWVRRSTNVEAFISHNGDLDYFRLHGVSYSQEDLQLLLAKLLHTPSPSAVDSAGVAGLLDLLRTRGMWLASARYGYVFGALAPSCDDATGSRPSTEEPSSSTSRAKVPLRLTQQLESLWSAEELKTVAQIFEDKWCQLVAERLAEYGHVLPAHASASYPAAMATMSSSADIATQDVEWDLESGVGDGYDGASTDASPPALPEADQPAPLWTDDIRSVMLQRMLALVSSDFTAFGVPSAASAVRLVRRAVCAFFEQDLLVAAQQLLASAVGSFGLVLSTSLDAHREMVIAARGQTMSIAFYPQIGSVLFGSEAAATKAGLGIGSANDAETPPFTAAGSGDRS
jgi:hypothetical protein